MNNSLQITKPIRFIVIMLLIALPSGILFASTPLLEKSPWLIFVPIGLGAVLVTIGEFWEEIGFGLGVEVTTEKDINNYYGMRINKRL